MLKDDISCETKIYSAINSLSKEGICELAAAKLRLSKFECSVIGLYRPPTSISNKYELFDEILNEIRIECRPLHNNVIIAGDFNINALHSSKKVYIL